MILNKKLFKNVEAIKLAINLERNEKKPNENEKKILNAFSGWGGLNALLYPIETYWKDLEGISKNDLKLEDDIKKFYVFLKDNFKENHHDIWNSIRESVLTSFYTPYEVPNLLFDTLKKENETIQSFLDPSAGTGIYIDAFYSKYPSAMIIGVEKDYISALILKNKYRGIKNITIFNNSFENVNLKEQSFDVIASNIPFGNYRVNYPSYPNEVTNKIHNFFFFHSQKLLKDGGLLSFITTTGIFNSPSNRFIRKDIASNNELLQLITLPKNLFNKSGTTVTTNLVNLKKKLVLSDTDKEFNGLIEKVDIDEEGILLNDFINNYKFLSFLKPPNIGTNPYGKEEYNYSLSLKETISELKRRIDIPKLSVKQISYENKLIFLKYPTQKIHDLGKTIQDKESDFILNYELKKKKIKIIGALKGNYLGYDVPLFLVAKHKQENLTKYLIQPLIENYVFKTNIINRFITAKEFSNGIDKFLNEITELCNYHKIKTYLDFRNEEDGYNFNKYIHNKFKQPTLDTYYITDDDLQIEYHRSIEKNDLVLFDGKISTVESIIFLQETNKNIIKTKNIELNSSQLKYLKKYLEIYDSVNRLKIALKEENNNVADLTHKLNISYDKFIGEYGFINVQKNNLLNQYCKLYKPIVNSLENLVEDNTKKDLFNNGSSQYEKADIFNFKLEKAKKRYTPKEALLKSLIVKKEINFDYLKKLTEKESIELEDDLKDNIIFDPLSNKYVFLENFFTGNLYKKVEDLKLFYGNDKEEIIEKVKKYIPEKISYIEIKKQFGSRWIPTKILKKFINKHYKSTFDIKYIKSNDLLIVEPLVKGDLYIKKKMKNGRFILPENIITNAFYDLYPTVTIEKEIDFESTNYYRKEIDLLKRNFKEYLNKEISEQEKDEIEEIYNFLYNNSTEVIFNNDILDFKDVNLEALKIKDIYPHQKQAIWKMITNRGGIVDHEVGFGKTLTMILSSFYMKKFGIAQKPIIIGLKTNVIDIAKLYRLLFPKAKILFATANDYEKSKREIFLNRIAMNNWDVIIMSHEQFQKIPIDKDLEINYIKSNLEDLKKNAHEFHKNKLVKRQVKSLERQYQSLKAKLEGNSKLNEGKRDQNVMTFSSLGIDHIIVDESHIFKNLAFQTRHTRVAGIGNLQGSNRANSLLLAIRTIQNKNNSDMGASFYSGTPISNSLTELYILQKYLTPNLLNELNIQNFDSWAGLFASKSIDFETNIVNQIKQKERFRYFINVPELSKMYSSIAHVMNGKNNLVDRPTKNEYLILNDQTPLQRRFNKKLLKYLETGDESVLNLEKSINVKDEKSANAAKSLIATNLSFKASLDMRLINSKYKDEKNSKVNITIKQIYEKYRESDDYRGTQIIFCEQSVSKKKLSYQELDENYKNNIFTSIYDDMKYKLIRRGVPENEIAFIQNYKSNKQKLELSEKMNKGEIRFLFGNTENAGTGLNIQKRLVRIIHLTIPWTPKDIEQRNGRGFRTGNWICKEYYNNQIDIAFSTTKNTLDNYKIDLIKNKLKFIAQIRNATSTKNRELDEGELSEDTGMNLAEFQAILSGDKSLLEKNKIDNQIKILQSEKEFIQNQQIKSNKKIKSNNEKIKNAEYVLQFLKQDKLKYKEKLLLDKKGIRINKPIYIGIKKEEFIENFLKRKWEESKKNHEDKATLKVGKLFGFGLYIKSTFLGGTKAFIKHEESKLTYEYRNGLLDFSRPEEVKKYFINCFNAIDRRIKSNENIIREKIEENKKQEILKETQFTDDDKLKKLIEKSEEIMLKLQNSDGNENSTFPTLEKVIEGKVVSIIHIDSLESLEKALLEDSLGEEHSVIGVFFSEKVTEFIDELDLATDAIDIFYRQLDKGNGHFFYKLEINDADELFIVFNKLKEQIKKEKSIYVKV